MINLARFIKQSQLLHFQEVLFLSYRLTKLIVSIKKRIISVAHFSNCISFF